ncbi:MAG: biotin/lipoyl-binding protein [Desulfomicrobium sp.]|nr:biotin/lipoyl-binding protein [Pseudomonadota bacterium]MBV1710496.1 biotin/lipoyl-binding protein [Desulfomicrobium sp.]MBU4570104.1 biotin/lipoyl-binding protein [Pseudomonadota bacterium]MBU4593023.1 biotin/lipoyl-binding protein [Pseudomonadota bacterium]MBV1720834.1 biotin/lipoyl-binding protein [Desulfomicrobium sp.]
MSDKNKSLTVFKTDRHEDIAAIVFSGLIVVVVLTYMAFIVPTVNIKVPLDGKLVEIFVTEGSDVAKGDKLYALEIVKKKWVNNEMQEKVVVEEFTAKTSGKILKVSGNSGDDLKKGKHTVVVMDHQKGTLP